MRKLLNICALALISFASTLVIPPSAQALPRYGWEVYYYNFGSQSPDGEEIRDCYGNQLVAGDTTPTEVGELKLEITTECSTGWEEVQWYRWAATGCEALHWVPISYPFYSNALPC